MVMPGKVDQILQTVDKMRPMPTSVTRILNSLDDPNNTAGIISDLIGLDQALAASVLQMANSAGAGFNTVCTSLSDAVMRIGFKRIKTLVLGAAASGPLTKRLNGYRLGAGELWNHSVSTATAAQWVSRFIHYSDPEEAYVAGLLHDMGKLILDQYLMVDYYRIVELIRVYNLALWQVEEKLLGIDHATIGSLMAQKWNFPPVLVEAIRHHHAPSLAKSQQALSAIINIANALSKDAKYLLTDPAGNKIHPESLRILNVDESQLQTMATQLESFRTSFSNRG
jgi:putative nucleotidyltransferase with HDIG domain